VKKEIDPKARPRTALAPGKSLDPSQSLDMGLSGDIKADDAYLLLKVPDFGNTSFVNATVAVDGGIDPAGINDKVLQSFLRLGSFDYVSEPPAAKELLKMITLGNAASHPGGADPGTQIIPELDGGIVFVDDVRVRPQDAGFTTADDHGHGLTLAERQAESARLYSRGGWRDHSDGNRITTTWGDKVEVIRGNYKMIVLGRQNDPELAMGWEASGSHIQDYAPGTMPGASYFLEWIADGRYHAPADPVGDGPKGVWLLANTTENVYEYARYAGNKRDEEWGDVHESYVGSENPPDGAFATDDTHGSAGHEPPHRIDGRNYDLPGGKSARATPPFNLDNKGLIRSNPHIIEKTWARRIDSWTGSEARRVPTIAEETWAEETSGITNVLKTVTETTTVGGAVTETTTVGGAVTNTTTVGGAVTETTTIGLFNTATTTVAGANTDTTIVGAANTATSIIAGLNTSMDFALGAFELGVTGGRLGVSATGIDIDVELYLGKVEAILGVGKFTFELGMSYELKLGKHEGYQESKDEKRLQKIESDISKTESRLEHQIKASTMNIAAMDIQLKTLSCKIG
jgi:hypothetical protein